MDDKTLGLMQVILSGVFILFALIAFILQISGLGTFFPGGWTAAIVLGWLGTTALGVAVLLGGINKMSA